VARARIEAAERERLTAMKRPSRISLERRRLLGAAVSSAGLALAGCATLEIGEGGEAEVTPGEDLMQEHGVLERVLLVYDEVVARIGRGAKFDLAIVSQAAGIVRRFVEDYHERNEEQFVFPRLTAARRESELVETLLRQHARGRELTDAIVQKAGLGSQQELSGLLTSFGRMYRPHAAREDTVIFPAFRELVGRSAYRELGEQFEDQEHQRFGEHGFESAVAEVAGLERALGIYDLAQFTPR
jgi:hemerythrin-like domain-containing protein